MRWRGPPPEALAWREYDDEVVVRNARTASTHLLDSFSAAVLQVLVEAGRALTIAEVASRLATDSAGDNDAHAWGPKILEVLEEFQRLGLAERETG